MKDYDEFVQRLKIVAEAMRIEDHDDGVNVNNERWTFVIGAEVGVQMVRDWLRAGGIDPLEWRMNAELADEIERRFLNESHRGKIIK